MTVRTVGGSRRFVGGLAAIALAALAFRLVYVLALEGHAIAPDGFAYHFLAREISDGRGMQSLLTGKPTANHPPLWPLVLAVPHLLGRHSVLAAQLVACCVGTATIVVTGFVGRAIASARTGLIAAAGTAVYAGVWVYEQRVLSETLLFLGIAALLLAAYDYLRHPGPARAALLGAICGLLTLTRAEQVLLIPLLLVPLILGWRWRGITRARLASLAVAVLVAAAVIAPWIGYNLQRFDQPVYLSDESGIVLAQGNCSTVYSGRLLGYIDINCLRELGHDAAQRGSKTPLADTTLRDEALRYMRDHAGRVPVVLAAREARVWSVYKPWETFDLEAQFPQHPGWPQVAALLSYWALLPLAVVGGVALHRRRVPLTPLVAPFVVAFVAVLAAHGEPRLRAGAEIPLVVLGAVGVDAVVTRLVRRRRATLRPA